MVLAGTAGAGRMAPPASTRISARLKRDQGHSSFVSILRATAMVAWIQAQQVGRAGTHRQRRKMPQAQYCQNAYGGTCTHLALCNRAQLPRAQQHQPRTQRPRRRPFLPRQRPRAFLREHSHEYPQAGARAWFRSLRQHIAEHRKTDGGVCIVVHGLRLREGSRRY